MHPWLPFVAVSQTACAICCRVSTEFFTQLRQAQTSYISHRHLTVVSMYRLCLPGQVCCSYLLSHNQCTSHSGGIGPDTKWLQLNLNSVTCRFMSTLYKQHVCLSHQQSINNQSCHFRSNHYKMLVLQCQPALSSYLAKDLCAQNAVPLQSSFTRAP